MSRLSVCITQYNRPEKLGHTLKSLARQTRPPNEVLLQDANSLLDPTPVAEIVRVDLRSLSTKETSRILACLEISIAY
jgi:GT2 family glycosyltransferase